MSKLKNISKALFILLIIMVIAVPKISLADSGFDFSYGGGGSDWGGSDWGGSDWGGSSWSDHDYSGGGGYEGPLDVAGDVMYILFLIIFFIIYVAAHSTKNTSYKVYRRKDTVSEYNASLLHDELLRQEEIRRQELENSYKELATHDPKYTEEYLTKRIKELYVKLQESFTARDLNEIRKITSDNLYNFYVSRFNFFKNTNEYQVIKDVDIERIDIKVINIINDMANIEAIVVSSEKNYYINGFNTIVRGNESNNKISYRLGLDLNLITEDCVINTKVIDYSAGSQRPNVSRTLNFDDLLKVDSTLTKDYIINKTYEVYEELQYSWSNFNIDKMRTLIGDELFNTYKAQLNTLKIKKQRNVMEDIEFLNGKVTDFNITNRKVSIDIELKVKQRDYIVNEDGDLLRGDEDFHTCTYQLTVEKGINGIKKKNCPNCGAELDISASQTCLHCGAELVDVSSDLIITKKRMLKQS